MPFTRPLRDANTVSVFNVRRYGAIGDGTSDDYAAIQRAIDHCDPNRGGTVYFPQGRYRISQGLIITNQGTELVGEGKPGTSRALASGTTRIISDEGVTAITCNPTPSLHVTLGYSFRRLHVLASSNSNFGNGIVVNNCEMLRVEDVTCSDYVNGVGLRLDGNSGNAQYAELYNFSAGDCLIGLHTTGLGPNGLRLFGGYFAGRGTTPRPGSKGIYIETGDTLRSFATVIQGYETGLQVDSQAAGHEIYGIRIEFCNIGVRLGGLVENFRMIGGAISNSILVKNGGSNIGILVARGAKRLYLHPTLIDGTESTVVGADTVTTTYSSYLQSDITLEVSNTFVDGPTLKLSGGTWQVNGAICIEAQSTSFRNWSAVLTQNDTIVCSAHQSINQGLATLTTSCTLNVLEPTTIAIKAASTRAGDVLKGDSFKQSFLFAVKLG